jgi:pimeloyl-ACP methyl ester carboxylesterase
MKPIPKTKIHTPSGKLEYAQSGKEGPAVVLINGGSGPIEGWYKTFHEISEETTVVAYNRLGVGGSDKPSTPQHGDAIVATLRQLLQVVNIHPPYILVGHSLGGLYANLFARQYPNEIAGPFPDVPLVVVSGGKKPPMMPEHAMEIRKNNQLDLVRLSKQGKHITASQSGHFPQFTEPGVVIQAVLECIHIVRKNLQ